MGQLSLASVSGSSSCGQDGRAGLPSPTCGRNACLHGWKISVLRDLHLPSSSGLLSWWHPKCLLTPLVLHSTRMPLQQQQQSRGFIRKPLSSLLTPCHSSSPQHVVSFGSRVGGWLGNSPARARSNCKEKAPVGPSCLAAPININ